MLHINSPGISGPVARAIIQVASDLLFDGHDNERSEAQVFIDRFREHPRTLDTAMLRFVQNDAGEVRHFLHQFCLIGGDLAEKAELAREWKLLSSNECFDDSRDSFIRDAFSCRLPLLHQREQIWVDPYLTDSLANEAEMSIKRRIHNTSLTSTSFEDRMYWEMVVLPPLRQCGCEAGNIQREASKAARDAKVFGPINKAAEVKRSE